MRGLVFTTQCGEEYGQVELSEINPNTNSYHIYIKGFYNGSVFLGQNNVWQCYFNAKSELTTEDKYIIVERLNEYLNYSYPVL